MTLLHALWIMLPIVLAGLLHVAAIKLNLWTGLAAFPLDLGAHFRNRRVFGENKTLRGLLIMPLATAVFALLQARVGASLALPWESGPEMSSPVLWGLALGLGYVLGELPNSFIKRQLDIPPGAVARGSLKPMFWICDQIDSLVGVLAFMCLWSIPSFTMIASFTVLTLFIHPVIATIMVVLGLKHRIG